MARIQYINTTVFGDEIYHVLMFDSWIEINVINELGRVEILWPQGSATTKATDVNMRDIAIVVDAFETAVKFANAKQEEFDSGEK